MENCIVDRGLIELEDSSKEREESIEAVDKELGGRIGRGDGVNDEMDDL